MQPSRLTNREGLHGYSVRWHWAPPTARGAFTAVLRVKDESRSLPFVLPPLLRSVQEVVLVDNGSTDGTPAIAEAVAADVGAAPVRVLSYPFSVARCGAEHLDTPADSVHSLTYFYNWSFSHVTTRYALKWDGDMVLTDSGVDALRDLAWQVETGQFLVQMPRYPLYVANSRTAFLDISVFNKELWGWPNRKGFEHTKAFEWELLSFPQPGDATTLPDWITIPDWSCVELKFLDADEFAHWSQDDFTASSRTRRKKREMEVFQSLAGQSDPPYGVIRVDSPDDRHVIEYIRSEWIPQQKPELAKQHEKVRLRMALRGD
jgi:glycosyltransferase involved in cell wall biosynthesis